VVFGDVRVQDRERSSERFWRLNFTGKVPPFLDLEGYADKPQAGWDAFFGGKPDVPERGFYDHYPVVRPRAAAEVVATVGDREARLTDGTDHPYMVTMRYGVGRTFWLGWGETWRLARFRPAYHERFWVGLARHVSENGLGMVRNVRVAVGRSFTTADPITFEAQLFGPDLRPLSDKARPAVRLTRLSGPPAKDEIPPDVKLEPVLDVREWDGRFAGALHRLEDGEYQWEVGAGSGEILAGRLTVKAADPERLSVTPDREMLFAAAALAEPVLKRLDEATREKVLRCLRTARGRLQGEGDEARLLFDLDGASFIPDCLGGH
jgi:hypothetical protein